MTSKLKFSILFVAIAFLTTTSIFAQFSRNDAHNLVLNTILSGEIGNVDVYSSYNSFMANVDLIDNDTKTNPYAESWVFFIDDNPFASWYHQCRLVFVNVVDGDYTIGNTVIYPKSLSTAYEEISVADRPAPIAMSGTAFVPDPEKVVSNYNHALIICAMDNPRNWYNTSLIFNVLLQNYNYQKDKITILYRWDGDADLGKNLESDAYPDDDIDGPATYANIQSTITDLTTTLGHGDQLAVFFTGVPVQAAGPTVKMGFPIDANKIGLYEVSSISQAIDHIDCGQMVFNFDVNSSTEVMSFFEATGNAYALCQNRYLTGPTGQYENNYAEMYFSGGNYSEQLFYWASAARGYLPKTDEPWLYNPTAIGEENGGGFPYATVIPNHPGDTYLDVDGDGFIQMGEAFDYATYINTWTDDLCHIPYDPSLPSPNPAQTDEFPFGEDLITLSGIAGQISNSLSIPSRSYIFAPGNATSEYSFWDITPSSTISFADYSELYLHLSVLKFDTIEKLSFGGNVYLYGEFSQGSIVDFSGKTFQIGENSTFENVILNLTPINPVFLSKINFINNYMTFVGEHLSSEQCYFEYSHFHTYGFEIVINKSDFIHSGLTMANYSARPGQYLLVDSCVFDGYNPLGMGIFIWLSYNTENIHILNSSFDGADVAIYANYTGYDYDSEIKNNEITNMAISGIQLINSGMRIEANEIMNIGKWGLQLDGVNKIRVTGNDVAHYVSETQLIKDCGEAEILAWTVQSFPTEVKWNAIIDEDNLPEGDPLVYCEMNPGTKKLDVRHNFWGAQFNSAQDLYPANRYLWDPVFELNDDTDNPGSAEILYSQGNSEVSLGNYASAKNIYKQVVSQFPASKYASASLKALLSVEQYEHDYEALKTYYLNSPEILNDTSLASLANVLANQCNLKLKNYPDAINWFEQRIQNPPSFADSINAIIELGNTYLVMEASSSKASTYVGSMPWYKPTSIKSHEDTTIYLLRLLKTRPYDPNINAKWARGSKPAILGQNMPNPFIGSTSISYQLKNESQVDIAVYNALGNKVKTLVGTTKPSGIYSVDFNAENIPPGMYFYSIQVNGKTVDAKKMMITK